MCIMQFNGSLLLSLTIQLRNYIKITYDGWIVSCLRVLHQQSKRLTDLLITYYLCGSMSVLRS